ncbi:MAG: hypothetical protein QGD94_12715, partial [Planctomycetia bacterium]|nr:hypothetical protein [Planctomycetia bacterium]
KAVAEDAPDGTITARIVHDFPLVGRREPQAQELVTVNDGDFRLGGEKWNPHGINYWPLSVIGLESTRYHSHWLDPTNYDPIVIERDLAQARDLGMNMLTIRYDRPREGPAVADFLGRCGKHGIKVNVFIQGTNPMQMNEELAADLIESAHLWQFDSMFAYDIAWEPRVGNRIARVALDGEWRGWVAEQYGTEENARADWDIEPPRDEAGGLAGPGDEQLINDGPWRRMVAAYRRFLDDIISRRINRIKRLILRLDPHHLIGYRAGYGGTGQSLFVHFVPFDLLMGAKHLDFISPEAYDMPNDWGRARGTGFMTAYARYGGNGKPVFWSEFGTNTSPDPTPEREQEKAKFWESMYRVVLDSGANGLAGWWWPAGLRADENS